MAIGHFAGHAETGSNTFYVNNINQSGLTNDRAYSLLYGTFSGVAASLVGQQLNVNGDLNVNGGIKQNTATTRPTCDSTVRGTTWFVQSAAGVKDLFAVCAKDAANIYSWRTLY